MLALNGRLPRRSEFVRYHGPVDVIWPGPQRRLVMVDPLARKGSGPARRRLWPRGALRRRSILVSRSCCLIEGDDVALRFATKMGDVVRDRGKALLHAGVHRQKLLGDRLQRDFLEHGANLVAAPAEQVRFRLPDRRSGP